MGLALDWMLSLLIYVYFRHGVIKVYGSKIDESNPLCSMQLQNQ